MKQTGRQSEGPDCPDKGNRKWWWVGAMAWGLRVLSVLSEDLSEVPSTHAGWFTAISNSMSRGSNSLF